MNGKIFRRPFQLLTSEDKAKTPPLEVIHSDVIGPMLTQTMEGYRYIIIFTDDSSRYTEVCFMKPKSDAPARLKENCGRGETHHSKSKVSRITVDGGGEYGNREKFLDYLAQEGISTILTAAE